MATRRSEASVGGRCSATFLAREGPRVILADAHVSLRRQASVASLFTRSIKRVRRELIAARYRGLTLTREAGPQS